MSYELIYVGLVWERRLEGKTIERDFALQLINITYYNRRYSANTLWKQGTFSYEW